MFLRKNWRPVSIFIVAIAVLGVYLLQTDTLRPPLQIFSIADTEKPTTPKPPPQGETPQSGHFHADGTFHADAHEISETVLPGIQSDGVWYPPDYTHADIAADLAGEGAATDEEYHRRAVKHAVNIYLHEHREKYPDCTETQAVIDDAKRYSEWVLADHAYIDKYRQLTSEQDRSTNELIHFLEKYNYSPADEATHIPESERLNDVERIKSLMAEIEAYGERNDALKLEKPPYPKPLHIH